MKLNRPLVCSTGTLKGKKKKRVMLWLDVTSASKNALKGYFCQLPGHTFAIHRFFLVRLAYKL